MVDEAVRNEIDKVGGIGSISNSRKYLALIQAIKGKYKKPSQRYMMLNTILSRKVFDKSLSKQDRTIIMNFFRSLIKVQEDEFKNMQEFKTNG